MCAAFGLMQAEEISTSLKEKWMDLIIARVLTEPFYLLLHNCRK